MNKLKDQEQASTRDGFGEALVELGKMDPRVVALSADLAESTRVLEFAHKFPQRFFEVGVAEQNMAGVAAGLAMEGFIPFMTSYAAFSPGRNWDQIRVSICYPKVNVKIVGGHAGITVGPDGATHQALEDIALMRVLPNMTVLVPADATQARFATIAAASWEGPVYIRLTREKTPVFYQQSTPFTIGKADVLREGSDVTIIACGPLVYEALEAAEQLLKPRLKYGGQIAFGPISAEVINMHTIKPLDHKTVVESAKKTGRVVTVEEHQVVGGLGSAIAEVLTEHCPVPVRRVGMMDSFGESGEPQELLAKYHMTRDDIVKAVYEVVEWAA